MSATLSVFRWDVDFCIELMESDRINVAYIMNLIRNIHFDDPKQKDYDIKHIKDLKKRVKGWEMYRGCVKTPNINKKNSLYVLVWMYNELSLIHIWT